MRLLVEYDEQVRGDPAQEAPFQHTRASKQQPLADDDGEERDVHRIPHVAIPPGDDEVLWRRDGCRCAEALQRESREGVENDREARDDEDDADPTERREAEQRWGDVPAAQEPRDVQRDRAGREHQEEGRAEYGAEAFHRGVSRCSSRCLVAGQSAAMIEKRTESRGIKSAAIRCPRKIPSNWPPMRASAARERSFRVSV